MKGILQKVVRRIFIDAYIISFPKSGRTWLKNILASYFCLKYNANFDQAIKALHKASLWTAFPNIRFTHDVADIPYQNELPYNNLDKVFSFNPYLNKKIVFLLRDPRDIVVSFFYHKKHREKLITGQSRFQGDLNEFIFDDIYGIKKIIAFLNLWADVLETRRHEAEFHVLKYEEMHKDPIATLMSLLDFLAIEIDRGLIEESFENSSRKKMIKRETSRLNITSDNERKTRKGVVGGYKDELSTEVIKEMDQILRKELSPYYRFNLTKADDCKVL